jgi:NHL repeat
LHRRPVKLQSWTSVLKVYENSSKLNYFTNFVVQLKEPGGICSDDVTGKLFIADTNNHVIQTIDTNTWELSEVNIKTDINVPTNDS